MRSALVLGGAACAWDDLEQAKEFGSFDATIAINDMLAHYPGEIDFAVSLHPEKYTEWMAGRDAKGYQRPKVFVAHDGNTQMGRNGAFPVDIVMDYRWPGMSASGSSGLFAVKVAIEQGFDRIILCGVPMDGAQSHFFDRTPWSEVNAFTEAWSIANPILRDVTRSMSGQTKEWLGYPTLDWLKS
ncbi:hypothetical protein [Rhizobium phaseoli]|uniref:Uncharacterized protein n=1 Tax=Rhizobium phaseoli TaxID=396 RepID=A0ABN4QG75_9HYPH|nr:hypothetical protein [Rhizobium phaseoli]ANL84667.1 hypothetical protein AMC81_CH01886 [Rhizobium phaseoli]ANL91174.1 hypothetical protein AMC80_CH01886 [Rhizobium phaseoli]